MKITNRDGEEIDFCKERLFQSISYANERAKMREAKGIVTDPMINTIVNRIYERCRKRPHILSVTEINDLVATELMKMKAYDTAKEFILYRAGGCNAHITLYTTGCPRCRELTEALNDNKIFYEINNDVDYMMKLGIDEVPVLQIQSNDGTDKMLQFEDAMDWVEENKNI